MKERRKPKKTKPKEIPPEHKCSRCKRDLRLPDFFGCTCIKSHPISGSSSGDAFWVQELDYNGFPKKI